MDLFGSGSSIMVSFLLFLIIFPLGIMAVVDRPNWDKAKWADELENDRKKHSPDVKSGADGPIPELIECALNKPNKFPPCSDTVRTALANEILLRKQYKDHNEDCNSPGTNEGDLILNPPQWESGLVYPLYLEWQEKSINSKLQFCDPLKYLRCSAEKKCVCLLGSIWSPPNEVSPGRHKNTCAHSHHTHCTTYTRPLEDEPRPTDGQQYFDPFKTSGAESQRSAHRPAPGCQEQKDVCVGDFSTPYFKELAYCYDVRGPIFNRQGDVYQYFIQFSNVPVNQLSFNDKCNFRDHNRLYTSTKEEDVDLEVRLKTLEGLMSSGTKFCDLRKFLTCGPSEKCECMPPSSQKDDKCVLPARLDKCSINAEMEPIFMNKTIVRRAREELMVGYASAVTVAGCEGKLTCHSEMMEMYCTCPAGNTGLECDEPLTKFLSIVRVPSLPTDVEGYPAKIKFFSDFNKQAVKFEKIFTLEEGVACVWKIQNEAEILVGGIQKLKYPGTNMTKRQYEELSKKIEDFTTSHQSQKICKDTLRCPFSTEKCVRQTRRDYLKDLREELEKFKTLKCNESGCSTFPEHMNDVMFDGEKTEFYGGNHDMEYNGLIQHDSKLLESNAKFCSVGGSCFESISGACVCQGVDPMDQNKENKVMNSSKMIQFFAHHWRLPINFVLLMSIAMYFVVNNC